MLVFTWKHVHTHLLMNGGVRHFVLLHTTALINSYGRYYHWFFWTCFLIANLILYNIPSRNKIVVFSYVTRFNISTLIVHNMALHIYIINLKHVLYLKVSNSFVKRFFFYKRSNMLYRQLAFYD